MTHLSSSTFPKAEGFGMSAICDDTVEFAHQSPAIDELLRQCECKDRFIAVAGHELRNLLAPIVTSFDVLIESADSESTADLITWRFSFTLPL